MIENFSIDFVIGVLVLSNLKSKIYNLILVIIDKTTKIAYYKPVSIKVIIDRSSLEKVILDIIYQAKTFQTPSATKT